MKKWTPYKPEAISKNIKKILDTGDIKHMTSATYKFVHIMSGFIAHYNQAGFMQEYESTEKLRRDLKNSMDIARPMYYIEDSFFQKDEASREYYTSKSMTLVAIKNIL